MLQIESRNADHLIGVFFWETNLNFAAQNAGLSLFP